MSEAVREVRGSNGGRGTHRLGVLGAGLAVLLGTVMFTGVGARAQGASPEWSIGDYWEFSGTGSLNNVEYAIVAKDVVSERAPITVATVTYDTFHVTERMDVSAPRSSFSLAVDKWIRSSDLATVKRALNDGTTQETITFDPPTQSFKFPLADRETWSETTNVTVSRSGQPPSTTMKTASYVVYGPASITVPAGTFNVFLIQAASGNVSGYSYYSDAVGYVLRSVLTTAGSPSSSLELKSFCYARASATGCSSLLWVVVLVLVTIVIVAAVAVRTWRRRRASTAEQGPAVTQPQTVEQQHSSPPQQPPAQPPTI